MRRSKTLKYGEAIREALVKAMKSDPSVFVMGLGVDDHKAIFGSTQGLVEQFGPGRVFDTPISEGGMTGVAIGAAVNGLKPVCVHIRNDFLYLAMDQLFNMAAKWRSMFGGRMSVPLVIRCVVGRGWGQGAQHSQNLSSFFMHVPGIKVCVPTTAADAQGLLLSALADANPVIIFEHRLLYDIAGHVPVPLRPVLFGRAVIRRRGKDMTIVANSYMVVESLRAAKFLSEHGVDVEIVDPITLVPLDRKTICSSVRKTGRLLVVDAGWITCGVSAEIVAVVADKAWRHLKSSVQRLGMQPVACPVSKPLEKLFYPNAETIVRAVFKNLGRRCPPVHLGEIQNNFKGPF